MNATRIPMPSPIHLAACKPGESRRFTFEDVACYIVPNGKAVLTATDGKLAAFVPVNVEIPADSRGRIILPHSAVKACKRTRKGPMPCISVNGAAEIPGGTSHPLPDQAQSFPPVVDVIPSDAQVRKGFTVTLNPELLLKLAESMGSGERVSLVVDPEGKKPMVVLPANENDGVGLLMPIDGSKNIPEIAVGRLNAVRSVITDAGESTFTVKGGAA
jgi:hypothetical protein